MLEPAKNQSAPTAAPPSAESGVERVCPELAFELANSRHGQTTLLLGGRRVHSAYDPLAEADKQAQRILAEAGDATSVLILGTGLGWLVAALRERAEIPVRVWEPFPELRRSLLCEQAQPNAGFELPAVDFSSLADFVAFAARDPSAARCFLAVHPGYEDFTRFEQRYALRALRAARAAKLDLPRQDPILSQRAALGLRRIAQRRGVEELAGSLKGQTLVIASGGPSLEQSLPVLAPLLEGGVLMAAPQALPTLREAGLRCDFVVHPDPSDLLSSVLESCSDELPFGALLADVSAHPAVLDLVPERCFLFHLRSPQLTEAAWRAAGCEVLDEPWVTVSEVMFVLARQLGARRIVLVGCDFASATRDYGAPFEVPSQAGQSCPTNPVYYQAARCLDEEIRDALEEGIEVLRLGGSAAVVLPALSRCEVTEATAVERARLWLRGVAAAPELPAPSAARQERMRDAVRSVLEEDFRFSAAPRAAGAPAVWQDFEALSGERAQLLLQDLREEFRR